MVVNNQLQLFCGCCSHCISKEEEPEKEEEKPELEDSDAERLAVDDNRCAWQRRGFYDVTMLTEFYVILGDGGSAVDIPEGAGEATDENGEFYNLFWLGLYLLFSTQVTLR